MNKITTILAVGAISLLPLAALAADAPESNNATKPAAGELHGFDKYWSKMDPTGKGFVTKDEFMKHQEERFKEIDSNGDGKISKEEMRAYDQKKFQHRRDMRAKWRNKKQDQSQQ